MSPYTDLSRQRFLIIAGTSKAGTTSIFNYLARHPQVCAAEEKETRFFLDIDYPLESRLRYQKDSSAAYASLFPAGDDGAPVWKLEATPDYMYSSGTARWIRETLPNVRLIFLLREPMSRLISFYRFGQTMGQVPQRMSFDEFVEVQKNELGPNPAQQRRHPAFNALANGCYSHYLRSFIDAFERPQIHIDFYEELTRAPHELMRRVCRFAGITERFFEDYSFGVANKGITVRSPWLHHIYWRSKQKIRSRLKPASKIREAMRTIGAGIDAVYDQANVTSRGKVSIAPATEKFIRTYYRGEAARLQEMLDVDVPWPAGWSASLSGVSGKPESDAHPRIDR